MRAARRERATSTVRRPLVAALLGMRHDQRVQFVVERGGGTFAEGGLDRLAQPFIAPRARPPAIAFEDTKCIGIGDKARPVEGIERDHVRGFRADAMQRAQLATQCGGIQCLDRREAAALDEPAT